MGALRKIEEDTVVYIPTHKEEKLRKEQREPKGEDIRLPPIRQPKTAHWEEGEGLDW